MNRGIWCRLDFVDTPERKKFAREAVAGERLYRVVRETEELVEWRNYPDTFTVFEFRNGARVVRVEGYLLDEAGNEFQLQFTGDPPSSVEVAVRVIEAGQFTVQYDSSNQYARVWTVPR